MTNPVSIALTEADVDLLDFVAHQLGLPNRSATVHTALCVLAQRCSGGHRVIEAAKRERESLGTRQRVRHGTGALRREVIGPLVEERE